MSIGVVMMVLEPREKFKKMFKRLPNAARQRLSFYYNKFPMSLNTAFFEVKNKTALGDEILLQLGYLKQDDLNEEKKNDSQEIQAQ